MYDTLSAIVSSGRTGPGKPALFIGLAGDAPHTPPGRIALGEVDRVDLGRGETRSIKHTTGDARILRQRRHEHLVVLGGNLHPRHYFSSVRRPGCQSTILSVRVSRKRASR